MAPEGPQGSRGEGLELRILTRCRLLLEERDGLLMVLDFCPHIGAIEGGAALRLQSVGGGFLLGIGLRRRIEAFLTGERRQLLVGLAVIGNHSAGKLLY